MTEAEETANIKDFLEDNYEEINLKDIMAHLIRENRATRKHLEKQRESLEIGFQNLMGENQQLEEDLASIKKELADMREGVRKNKEERDLQYNMLNGAIEGHRKESEKDLQFVYDNLRIAHSNTYRQGTAILNTVRGLDGAMASKLAGAVSKIDSNNRRGLK